MDVLKELFGTQDEVHIAKSLFGRPEQTHIEPNVCEESFVQQIDHTSVTDDISERSVSSSSQPVTFPRISSSETTHRGAEDIESVPEEMPMYLLEEDEGNDEEIIRLLGTPPLDNSCRDNLQTSPSINAPITSPCSAPSVPTNESTTASVLFPWMVGSYGVTVTPVQLVANSPAPLQTKKRQRHKGGWPKGKSRKPDSFPHPKPPSTGYGLFLSEHMTQEKSKFSSMSQLSKHLGKLWSALPSSEKKVYYQKADVDRQRYLSEMRSYMLTNGDHILTQIVASEKDDSILLCDICKLSFTSLHNKKCHFSGKLHMQTILKVVQSQTEGSNINGNHVGSSMADVCTQTSKYSSCVTELCSTLKDYHSALASLATYQQTLAEQEFVYNEWICCLHSLDEEWSELCDQARSLLGLTSLRELYPT